MRHLKVGVALILVMNFVDDRGNASVYDGSVSVQHLGGGVRLPE